MTGIVTAAPLKRIVVQGGNLMRISLEEMGDPLQWYRIAQLNRAVLRKAGAVGGCDAWLPANVVLELLIPPALPAGSGNGGVMGA